MELFWKIKSVDRARLIQLQYQLYGTKLDLAGAKAPWEIEPPRPQIPVRPDMTPEELGKFISQPPEHQEKVD